MADTDPRSPLVVWWIKRDIRLADNAALCEAVASGLPVLPLFCFEPTIERGSDFSEMHRDAQIMALTDLRSALQRRGSELYLSFDDAVPTLKRIHATRGIKAIFAHEEIGNDLTFRRDRSVAAWCRAAGVQFLEFPQSSVRRARVDRDRLHEHWCERIVIPKPVAEPVSILMTSGMRTSSAATWTKLELPSQYAATKNWQAVSETAARATLNSFLSERSKFYRGGISSPNSALSAGSRLSPHLAWGTISLRTVYHRTTERLESLRSESDPDATRFRRGLQAFLSRLHWRDHFVQRLESEPQMEFRALHPLYRDVPYENDPALLDRWLAGTTGFPLVDAVMRCLAVTGFVNFRMRAFVTSIACHALHLDWRLIQPGLARIFRDYEPGIHLSQLQMQAGVVGLNTIRVYSPAKQLSDQDPECHFVRRWIPELAHYSTPEIISHQLQREHPLGRYPAPCAEWSERSRAMRDALYALRKHPQFSVLTDAVYTMHGSRKTANQSSPRRSRGASSNSLRRRTRATRMASRQLPLFREL